MKRLIGFALLLAFTSASARTQDGTDALKSPPGCGPRILVEYTDDDPDYFIVKNRSPQGWFLVKLGIDLRPTVGNLVFDPDEGGAGVGGAAEFYAASTPSIRVTGSVPAQDGGKSLALSFEGFDAGLDYSFTIDLDSLGRDGGTTWVLPQDIKSGRIVATFRGPSDEDDTVDANFAEDATADSGAGGCV
jgi:hypothetical protein